MRLRVLAFVALAVPSVTLADDLKSSLRSCAELQDSQTRLECFDRLAASAGKPEASSNASDRPEAGGQWNLTRETSPIDDTQVVYFSLAATQTTPAAPGRTDPTLFIRCKAGKIESFLNWGVPVATRDIDVTTRFDDDEAETKKWTLSTDFTSTFVKGSQAAFVAKLRAHHRFVARLLPLHHDETTAIFDLSGLNGRIDEVFGACERK